MGVPVPRGTEPWVALTVTRTADSLANRCKAPLIQFTGNPMKNS
jgi:hypothetical protein